MSKKFVWFGVVVAIISLVLSVSALVGGNQSAAPVKVPTLTEMLGAAGDIVTNVVSFTKGVKLGDTTQTWVSKQLEVGSNQVLLYTNRTGSDVEIGYGDVLVKTGDTASSTTLVNIFATTTSSVPTWADFGTLAEGKRALIQAMPVATSTTASTTSSIAAAIQAKGNGTIVVPDGFNVFGYLKQNTTGCQGAVGVCEAATSTRRGFNPVFTVRIHD